jgi:hypothetical protein
VRPSLEEYQAALVPMPDVAARLGKLSGGELFEALNALADTDYVKRILVIGFTGMGSPLR